MADARAQSQATEIAYLLKGYPRLSEIFIASEIYRLEQRGLDLSLFVIRPPDEPPRHEVVQRVRARPQYLQPVTTVSGTTAVSWLRKNLRPFLGPLTRVARRRPLGLARASAAAAAQAVRARPRPLAWPRRLYMKELLLAVDLADRLLERPRVRHLHAHFAHGSATVSWLASLMTGLPYSFTGHAKDIYSGSLNPAGLLRRKLAAASFAVSCSDAGCERLREHAGTTPVHRIYHGINADFARLLQSPAAARDHGVDGVMRLLAVGRLVPKKGFDVLIEACDLLARRGIDFELTIAGEDGEQGDELRRLIAELRLARRVVLAGPLDQVSLHRAYTAADVFCLPCRVLDDGDRDGIPNVLVEAMACELPVVTTPISGIPELVRDGDNGVLVPAEDAAALAAALERLGPDAAARAAIARTGRVTVEERFDGDRLARELASLFEGAIA